MRERVLDISPPTNISDALTILADTKMSLSWDMAGASPCMEQDLICYRCLRSPTVSTAIALAPSTGLTLKQIKCGALAGLPVAIDAASLVADFAGPEGQAAKVAAGFGLSLAATFTSAANGDAGGAVWGAASFTRAPLEVATKSAGLTGLAQWIPGVGAFGDGIATIHDISGVGGAYSTCMAKP